MYSLEYPELLIVFPFLAYCLYRCREKVLPRYFVHLQWFSIHQGNIDKEFWYKSATLFWLLVSVASPVKVNVSDPQNRNGIAIAIAIDASGSMVGRGFDTKELLETKFESVKEVVGAFLQKRINDNIGIVLFGDFAFTASPLTYEKEALQHMVNYLTLGMAGQNTAIGEGILESVHLLASSQAKEKIIVLLTDGMHNAGATSPKVAIDEAQRSGIKLYTIGIGGAGDYNAQMLSTLATQTNGTFFQAPDKEALEEVYKTIDTLEASKIRSRDYHFKSYYFIVPLLMALLFFALYIKSRYGRES